MWGGPIVYADPSNPPLHFHTSAQKYAVVGIIALEVLQLPTIGEQTLQLEIGSVALFKGNMPVTYKDCKGRGILFYLIKT